MKTRDEIATAAYQKQRMNALFRSRGPRPVIIRYHEPDPGLFALHPPERELSVPEPKWYYGPSRESDAMIDVEINPTVTYPIMLHVSHTEIRELIRAHADSLARGVTSWGSDHLLFAAEAAGKAERIAELSRLLPASA